MNTVIDGVIFQIQAGRPHGISRMWRSLIPELAKLLPEDSITILRRCGSELPLPGFQEETIPPFCFGPNEILEADDQMLTGVCRELQADVFLSTYYTRAMGVENVLFMYDMIPEIMKYNLSEPQWSAKQRAIANAHSFLSISESTGDDLARIYNVPLSKITVAHLGVSQNFRPANQADVSEWLDRVQITRPYYLLVGNRGLYKNGVAAFEAMSRIPQARGYDIIAVGGEPRLTPEEEKFARHLNVRLIRWLSDEDLRLAYSGAMALIYPSIYEGFGLPVAEAMASGCPVITMRASSLPEVGGDAPIYVTPGSAEELAQAIVRGQNQNERRRMAAAGIAQATNFNWKRTAQAVTKAITVSRENKGKRRPRISRPETSKWLSIVFPIHGLARRSLGEQLDALKRQTIRDNLEVIVVGSEEEFQKLQTADEKRYDVELKLIEGELLMSGCNRALRQARGRYLTLGRQFGSFARDAFASLVEWMDAHPDVGLGFVSCSVSDGDSLGLARLVSEGNSCSDAIWRSDVHGKAGYFNPALSYEARHEFYVRAAWSCGASEIMGRDFGPQQDRNERRVPAEIQNQIAQSLYAIRRLIKMPEVYPSLKNCNSDPNAWAAAWLDFGTRCARTNVPDLPLAIAAYQTALRTNGLTPDASAELHLKVGNNIGLVLALMNRAEEGRAVLAQVATFPAAAKNKARLDREAISVALDPYSFEWAEADHPVVRAEGKKKSPAQASATKPVLPEKSIGNAQQTRPQQHIQAHSNSDGPAPMVSAIVSTYNSEKLIRACLEDLLSQTLCKRGLLEIIVVDSGSPQNEQSIVREFQAAHKNIRYIRTEERETIYAAWNRAIQAARGKYVTNANTDDAHRPDALERLMAALEKFPQADLAYGDYICTAVPNDSFASPHPQRPMVHPPSHPALVMFFCPMGCHPFWRRSVFEKIGYFDPAFTSAGDYEFLFRFVKAGLIAVHVPETLSLFYQNRDGIQFRKGSKSQEEGKAIHAKYRTEMPIERLFRVHKNDLRSESAAWLALGNLAMCHNIPWFNEPRSDLAYAASSYQRALEVDPQNGTAQVNLTIIALCRNEIDKAEQLLKRIPPDQMWKLKSMGDPKQLAALLPVEAAPATPTLEFVGSCDAEIAAGEVNAERVHSLKRTRAALEKAVLLEPENADLLESLAIVLFQSGDFALARQYFVRVTGLRSTDASAYFQLALANLRLECIEEFEAALSRALEIDPEHSGALKLLADIQFEFGKFQEAAQAYGRIVQRDPKNIASLLRLGTCFQKSGEHEIAETVFSKVLELEPENSAALDCLKGLRVGECPSSNAAAPERPAPLGEVTRVSQAKIAAPEERRTPLVSAIVSTYNSERFIRGCLEDLVEQTLYRMGRLEIVVVDSGSQQNERAIVEEFQRSHSNIIHVRTEERETVYGAWNRGVEAARGKYLTNANTDDRHRTDALEILANELEQNSSVALVYADQIITKTENEVFHRCTPVGFFNWPEFDRVHLLHTPCCGPQAMWRKALHSELGLFDASLRVAGDYEWWLRVATKYPFKHRSELLGLYLLAETSVEHRHSDECREETRNIRRRYAMQAGLTQLDYGRYKPMFLTQFPPATPLVSVIIPTCHRLDELSATIGSVLKQSFQDFEIILLNDGGPDAEPLIRALPQSSKIICYQHRTKRGEAAVRESAITLARGKYIAYADDQWRDRREELAHLVEAMEKTNSPVSRVQGKVVLNPPGAARSSSDAETSEQQTSRSSSSGRELAPFAAAGSPAVLSEKEKLSIFWLGPIFDPSGYADEARNFILRLGQHGFDLVVRSLSKDSETFRKELPLVLRSELDTLLRKNVEGPFVTVVHFPGYAFQKIPDTSFQIGRTMFETDRLPLDWVEKCNLMDEVWVPSDLGIESFRRSGVKTPLVKIPGGVDVQQFRPGLEPLVIPGVRKTVFLSVFEWIYRKGWDVLLQAWAKAFSPNDDVCLVLRTYPMGAADAPDAKDQIEGRIDDFFNKCVGLKRSDIAPIIVLGGQIPAHDLPRLYAAAHAYVAPSRGEGWGRPQMEAMACGLPTIATRWGGTQEFMTDENSLLLDFELVEVDGRCELSSYHGHRWAEPSIEHLASLMRRVIEEPAMVSQLGQRAREDMVQNWSWDKVAEIPAQRLRKIHAEINAKRMASPLKTTNIPSSDAPNKTPVAQPTNISSQISPGNEASRLVHQAEAAQRGGDLAGARDHLVRASQITPRDPAIWVQLASAHLVLEQVEDFETALGRALELDPQHHGALKLLGDLNFQNAQWKDAGQAYLNILRRSPDDIDAMIGLGSCLMKGGQAETAASLFERVLEIQPTNAAAQEALNSTRETRQSPQTSQQPRGVSAANDGFLVSAIVSTYNAEEFIRGCLQDLVDQTLFQKGQLEILVIDSGSEQNEQAIVREFQQRHKNIIYERTPRETLYAAWNRAVKLARGKYLTPANTDDRHRRDALETMARVLEEKRVGFAYADVLLTSGINETFAKNTAQRVWELPQYSLRQALMHCPFGSKVMWARVHHGDVGFFDPSFTIAGDYEFLLRIARQHGAVHIPETLGLYYESEKNLSYANQQKVLDEVNRFLKSFRRSVALEEIYPFLRQDRSPFARAAALVDWANQLAWASGYPDLDHASELYNEAAALLGSQTLGVQNNLALVVERQGRRAEAWQALQRMSVTDETARHNFSELQARGGHGQWRIFALAHPALETMPPALPSLGRRIPLAEYQGKQASVGASSTQESETRPLAGVSETVSPRDPVIREGLKFLIRQSEGLTGGAAKMESATSAVPSLTQLLSAADAEYQKGNLAAACGHLQKAAELDSMNPEILASLGTAAFSLGDFEAARDAFQKVTEIRPQDPSAFVHLALSYFKLERVTDFESALAQALEIDPDHREALKLLADLNLQHGSLKDAAQTYTKILNRNPNDVDALLPLGVCFFKTGDLEMAKEVFQRVLKIEPNNSLATENLEAVRRRNLSPAAPQTPIAPLIPKAEPTEPVVSGLSKTGPSQSLPKTKSAMDRVNELIDQANFFNEAGNREAALESLEQAAEISPRDAELQATLGSHYFTVGNFEAARAHFRRLIELRPRDPDAYTRLAMVCLKLNRVEEMESALGIALEIDPNNREALKFLAKTNLENSRVRDAGRMYAKILEKHPDDVESLLTLGLCFYRGGDSASARMVYERVLEVDPYNATARENLIQLGESPKPAPSTALPFAASELPQGLSDKPKKLAQLLTKADAAFANQEFATACDALKAALELSPDTSDILSALGTLCYQLGEMQQARTYLRRLVQHVPDDPGHWARLALTHYQLEEIPEFEAALGKALELDPDHVEALRMLAHLNFNHGSMADAAQQYGKVLKQRPDDLEVILALGVCFFKMRDLDAAQMMFERALELDPANVLARENLEVVRRKQKPAAAPEPAPDKPLAGKTDMLKVDKLLSEAEASLSAGNIPKACSALQRASENSPNDPDIFATLGSLLYQSGDYQASEKALSRAVRLRPDSADFQTRLAVTFLILDRIADFEAAMSRALELEPNYVPALKMLADLNLQQKKYKDAADTYYRILRKDPDNIEAILAMGICFYKTGDVVAARLMYERILKLQPDHAVARENLNVILGDKQPVIELQEIPAQQQLLPAPGDAVPTVSTAISEAPVVKSGEQGTKSSSDTGSGVKEPAEKLSVVWEGSQFLHHSLALINREVCLGLIAGGHDISILPFEADQFKPDADPRFRQLASRVRASLEKPAKVHVRHQWPLNLAAPDQGYWVVIQPWEFGSAPKEWATLFQTQVDEIWVPSTFVRNCYVDSGVAAEKVFVVPNGVNASQFHPAVQPMALRTKKKFKFLFVGGTIYRKGADLLLQAYLNRFTAADDVCLVIKDFGGETVYQGQTIEAKVREIQGNAKAPEILYLSENLPPDALPGLYTACDCLVHPYRGEGFGLPIIEAMACGLPVIVTAGGAADDFATAEFAYKIPAVRKGFGSKVGNMELAGEGWLLEPDLAALTDTMRSVVENCEAAKELGRKASAHVRSNWTWHHATKKAEERLLALSSRTEAPLRLRSSAGAPRPPAKVELPPIATLASLKTAHDFLARKKYLKAWNAALEAISIRPFHPDAYLQMVEIALGAEDDRQAYLCAERLIQLTPNWEMAKKIHAALKPVRKGRKSKIKWTPLPVVPSKPRLSVCLIAKNEERFIGQCLASVKPIASQIVVVDTGSTDRTVEIAKEYGAEVYHFPWNDNFSDARNVAHEHARGDWVLILDADEEMRPESHPKLAQDMADANVLGYRIPICNLHEASDSVTYVPRLFRNAPAFFFVGRVHEQIYASVTARTSEWGMEAKLGTATIVHHGYDPEVIRQRGKVKRNLRLLEKAIEEIPNEAALLMNYGLDLVNDGRLEEGYEKYREAVRALAKAPSEVVLPEVRERLVTIFGSHLVKGQRMEELLELTTSKLALDSGPTASVHFLAGLALMKSKRFEEAIPHYRQCLVKRHKPTLTPPCAGIMTGAPHHLLAECLMMTEQMGEAEEQFKQALAADPKAIGVIHDYAGFLHKQNRSLEALQLLHGAIAQDLNDERIWQLGGYISNSKPDFIEFALDWTGEAAKYFPEHEAIGALRGETLLKAGRLAEALPFFEKEVHASKTTGQAAILLCRLVTDQNLDSIVAQDLEGEVSREFLGWYRRLLATNAQEAVRATNARLDQLRRVLPTAAAMLGQALAGSKET